MHHMTITNHQHAQAVRNAIYAARAVNQQWLAAESQPLPTAAATGALAQNAPGLAPCVHDPAPTAARATYVNVTEQDLMLGLKIGKKLVVFDDSENRHSAVVRSVDSLLTRAKKMVDADKQKGFSFATKLESQPGTSVSVSVVPNGKGGTETTMHFEREGMSRQRIYPVGIVDFHLD